MAVISDAYKDQLQTVHSERAIGRKWGTTGARNFGDYICKFLEHRRGQISTVLDFGAGQGSLGKYVQETAFQIDVKWTNYDPGVPGIDVAPQGKFDLIVSSDVLEHVEPEEVDNVIQWLSDHATKAQFHHIACDPCGLTLPDGRNAHLITENVEWWLKKFESPRWALMYAAQCTVRKRRMLRDHCHIQIDKT
jgi:2-polyprenyl-3-methyl-5-hydroxy-6-metoxy-1,4-benzoquinol methylase